MWRMRRIKTGGSDVQPLGPAVVEHEPRDEAVAGLTRVYAVARGGQLRAPLVVPEQRPVGVDERYEPARADVGLGLDEDLELGVDLGVGGGRGADDERPDPGGRRLVEDVGQVEAVPRQGPPRGDVTEAHRDDQPLLGAPGPPWRALDLPALEDIGARVAPDPQVVCREVELGVLAPADDAPDPALALRVADAGDHRGTDEDQPDVASAVRGRRDRGAGQELVAGGVSRHALILPHSLAAAAEAAPQATHASPRTDSRVTRSVRVGMVGFLP